MPVTFGKDKKGNYVKWGKGGKHFYFKTEIGMKRQINHVKKISRAIHAQQNRNRY
jgi:hypothetical protein